MQLHTTADGQEHEMSVVSYPRWSASTSHDQRADPSADGQYNHWWPSQAYHCTFCPRVFRTAQALGGHMNIHRRERAFANDTGTHHFHTRRGDSSQASNSILSRSSSHPAATLEQLRSSLFSSTPPAPGPVSCKENCYANRRIAVTPDLVTTANFFAPIQAAADMTYHHRVGWNHGGDAAKLEEASVPSGHNISDPLSWLFSQLPPPGSVSTLQRQQSQSQPQPQQNQNQQQQQQCRGGNILMQKNLAKPYHRAVAVRRSGGHPSPPFSEQNLQARGRVEAGGGSRNGEQEDGDGDEGLDLELRL